LPGEAEFGLDEDYVGKKAGGGCDVRRVCVGDEDFVWLSCLFGQKGDGFGEDRRTVVRGDANHKPGLAFHGDQINAWFWVLRSTSMAGIRKVTCFRKQISSADQNQMTRKSAVAQESA
jgi:hypothetical protein